LKRGEIWTVAGGRGYAGKPRPAVIVQADDFSETASVTVCLLTTTIVDAPAFRIAIGATAENGLRDNSFAMVDKINTIARQQVDARLGQVEAEEMARIDTAIMVFLGLAG
jgi:mRNA interferase MazF